MIHHEDIIFYNNNLRLFGKLHKQQVDKRINAVYPVIVVLHGSHMGEASHSFYDHLINTLTSKGIGVFVYDRRGCGQSDGNFDTASLWDLADDALAAVKVIKSRDDIDKELIGMYGISQGGWIAPLAASMTDDISFLILVSASGVSPSNQMIYAAITSLRENGFSEEIINHAIALKKQVDDYYRGLLDKEYVEEKLKNSQEKAWYKKAFLPINAELPLDVRKAKWFYQLDFNPLGCLSKVNIPMLFMFADHDLYVPVEESTDAYRLATLRNPWISFIRVENTDHFMMPFKENEKEEGVYNVSDDYLNKLLEWLMATCSNLNASSKRDNRKNLSY